MSVIQMTEEIIADLTEELSSEPDFSASILKNKVKAVIRELRMKRNYIASGMSEDEIDSDMENYYSVVLDVARYDYNQRGAEGELSHTENGISRMYESRDNLWKGVHAYVKVL